MTEFDDAVAELDRKIEAAETQVENAKKGVLAKKELRDRLMAEEERYKALAILRGEVFKGSWISKDSKGTPYDLVEFRRLSAEMESIIANRKNRKVHYELSVEDARKVLSR